MTGDGHRPPTRILRQGLAFGLLWGIGVSASESLALPFGQFESMQGFVTFLPILLLWMVVGMLLACYALAIEPWLDQPWKVAAAIVLAALGAAVVDRLGWAVSSRFGVRVPSEFLYVVWMMLFHGGLFIVACVIVSRTERSMRVLGDVEIARDRTQALLDTTVLDSLHGQIDPALLMRALAAVRDRYAQSDPGGDPLLDQLVTFLRLAMQGTGTGRSTLAAELALARSYASLASAIEPARAPWQVLAREPLPDLAFPPLLLVPLMEALAPPTRQAASILHVEGDRRHVRIATDIEAGVALPASLHYRLRVALQSAYGHAWRMDGAQGAPGAGSRLTIDIGPCPAPTGPPHPRVPSQADAKASAASDAHRAPVTSPQGALP